MMGGGIQYGVDPALGMMALEEYVPSQQYLDADRLNAIRTYLSNNMGTGAALSESDAQFLASQGLAVDQLGLAGRGPSSTGQSDLGSPFSVGLVNMGGAALGGAFGNPFGATAPAAGTEALTGVTAPSIAPIPASAALPGMAAPSAATLAATGTGAAAATAPAMMGGTIGNAATSAGSTMAGDSNWWQTILQPFGGGADASAFENVFAALQGLGGLSSLGGGNALSDLFGFTNSSADDAMRSATIGAHGTSGPGGASTQYDPATGQITASGGNLDPFQGQLAQYAQSQLGQADSAAQQQKYLDLLRQQAQPYEQQVTNSVNNNLFSRGRLGAEDSTTGLAYRELAKGLSLADLSRQTTALDYGQQETQNVFDRARLSGDLSSQLQNRAFAPQAGATNTNIASANAQLGVGTGLTNLGMTTTNPLDALMQYLSSRQP